MLLPKRVWKDIPGWEGLYQVSNTGKVRSLGNNKSKKTKILKPGTNNHGYKRVGLYKNGKSYYYLVHRLVAMSFIPNPNNYPVVNHKDENKQNNCSWNLEWCTQDYNIAYSDNIKMEKQFKEANKIIQLTLDIYNKCNKDCK